MVGDNAMDARSSRYHEVYARAQRDPQGFWGEAAAAIDWNGPTAVFWGDRCRRSSKCTPSFDTDPQAVSEFASMSARALGAARS